jgi:hypothetical protein
MIRYEREKMLAGAASVKAIDDWPGGVCQPNWDYGDVDDASAAHRFGRRMIRYRREDVEMWVQTSRYEPTPARLAPESHTSFR